MMAEYVLVREPDGQEYYRYLDDIRPTDVVIGGMDVSPQEAVELVKTRYQELLTPELQAQILTGGTQPFLTPQYTGRILFETPTGTQVWTPRISEVPPSGSYKEIVPTVGEMPEILKPPFIPTPISEPKPEGEKTIQPIEKPYTPPVEIPHDPYLSFTEWMRDATELIPFVRDVTAYINELARTNYWTEAEEQQALKEADRIMEYQKQYKETYGEELGYDPYKHLETFRREVDIPTTDVYQPTISITGGEGLFGDLGEIGKMILPILLVVGVFPRQLKSKLNYLIEHMLEPLQKIPLYEYVLFFKKTPLRMCSGEFTLILIYRSQRLTIYCPDCGKRMKIYEPFRANIEDPPPDRCLHVQKTLKGGVL